MAPKPAETELLLDLNIDTKLSVHQRGWKSLDAAIASGDVPLRVDIRQSMKPGLSIDVFPSVCDGSIAINRNGGTVSVKGTATARYSRSSSVVPKLPADVRLIAILDANWNEWPLTLDGLGVKIGIARPADPQPSKAKKSAGERASPATQSIPELLALAVLRARRSNLKVVDKKRRTWWCELESGVRITFDGHPLDEKNKPNLDTETYVVAIDAGTSNVTFFVDVDGCTTKSPTADAGYIDERYQEDLVPQARAVDMTKKALEATLRKCLQSATAN